MNDKIFIVTHKKLDKIIKKKGYSYIQVGNKDIKYNSTHCNYYDIYIVLINSG